jgi:hypothetical protein
MSGLARFLLFSLQVLLGQELVESVINLLQWMRKCSAAAAAAAAAAARRKEL